MDSTCFDLKRTSLYAKDPLGWGRERREKPDEFDTNEKKEPDIVGRKEREGERRGHGRSQDEENSNVRKISNYFINMFCTYFKFMRGSSGRKFFEYSGTRYISSNVSIFTKEWIGENYPSKIRFLRGKEN